MTDLAAVAEDVQRVLPFDDLLYEVGDDVRHRELDVAAGDLGLDLGPHLPDSYAIEGPHDRVRQAMLFVRGAREVLDRQLLKSVRRSGRWELALLSFVRRPSGRRFEDHRRADERDLLQPCRSEGADGRIAR